MTHRLYLGTDEGVVTLARKNGGWEVAAQGVNEWSIHEVQVDPSAPERIVAGTRGDGVWLSTDAGASWSKPCYGRPGPGKTRCVTLDPSDPKRVFVGGEPIEIYVSDNQGKTWDRLDSVRRLPFIDGIDYPVSTVEPHVRDIAIDPTDSNIIYAALQVGGMLRSTDGGKTWDHIENDVDCDIHTIVVDADHPNVIVVATGGHDSRSGRVKGRALYRSGDRGDTWSPVAMQFSQEYSVPLVPNPRNTHTIYSALSHGTPGAWRRPSGAEAVVVRTRDAGKNWEQVDAPEDASRDFPRAIALDQEDPDTIFMGVKSGILESHDAGRTWQKHSLQVPAINDIKCA